MPVKQDPQIVADLAAINLVVWEAKHPREPFVNKSGNTSTREDKSWVLVTLAGPGVENAVAGAPTFAKAVRTALVHSDLHLRVEGVTGAILRLERAVWDLSRQCAEERYREAYGDLDDDIPF